MDSTRSDQVTQIIADEINAWSTKHGNAAGMEKIAIHGALCQLMMYAGCPENVTRERLLCDHKVKLARSRMNAVGDDSLCSVGRARASKQVEAIVSLGIIIKQVDNV